MPQCSYHSDVETNLRCSRCEKYICPRELVQTPVGARCPECARVRRVPTFDVRTGHLVRAGAAALGAGVGLGLVWGFFMPVFRKYPFVPWLVALGVAYLVGEATSLAVNRKRGPQLAAIAAVGVIVAFAVSAVVWGMMRGWGPMTGLRLQFYDLFGLIILVLAVIVAAGRVR